MDMSSSQPLSAPPLRVRFAPVYWEPMPGSGERICAILLIAPVAESAQLISPAAHVVISARRLRAMLGLERGASASGILRETADYMTRRLHVSTELEDCTPPFRHFSVGAIRSLRAFTAEQALDAAVRMTSTFGSTDDLLDEVTETSNHSTATTREFLSRVQSSFAPADDERRKRFMQRVTAGAGEVVIDYAYNGNLVQFASAPVTERQSLNMKREAESKMLETLTVLRTVLDQNGTSRLFINTAQLHAGGISGSSLDLANMAMAHYRAMAGVHGFQILEVASYDDAVHALQSLA